MARYAIDEDTVVDTSLAVASWQDDTRWDGNNHISVATGSQWVRQTLYRSRKGRYYVETISAYQGSLPHAEWMTEEEAARWLVANGEALPEDLASYEESICE